MIHYVETLNGIETGGAQIGGWLDIFTQALPAVTGQSAGKTFTDAAVLQAQMRAEEVAARQKFGTAAAIAGAAVVGGVLLFILWK